MLNVYITFFRNYIRLLSKMSASDSYPQPGLYQLSDCKDNGAISRSNLN